MALDSQQWMLFGKLVRVDELSAEEAKLQLESEALQHDIAVRSAEIEGLAL